MADLQIPAKPGPHLHPSTTPTPAADTRPSFRDLAKHHARAASVLLQDVTDMLNDDAPGTTDELLELTSAAQAHALVAIACSGVAPVARQRLIPCTTKAGAK